MITIGRLTFAESDSRDFEESWSDEREVALAGTMHSPETSYARMKSLHDDVLNSAERLVPVIFTKKSHRNGYYRVKSAKSTFRELVNEQMILLTWEIELVRVGSDNEVDLESRISGPLARLNDHGLSAERWNAPPVGHDAYWSGPSQPPILNRVTVDGPLPVHRNLALNTNPRWHCKVQDYHKGAVAILEGMAARVGVDSTVDPGWVLSNSLLRVSLGVGRTLDVSVFSGGAWQPAKGFNVQVNAVSLGAPLAAAILRNEPHVITLRLLYNQSPSGRITVDLTLRRGAPFVEITMQSLFSSVLGIVRSDNEASTATTGFVRATSNDASGHRYLIGSARSFVANTGTGGISKAAVVKLDAFIGIELAGTAAVSGNTGTDLLLQYLSAAAEEIVEVRL